MVLLFFKAGRITTTPLNPLLMIGVGQGDLMLVGLDSRNQHRIQGVGFRSRLLLQAQQPLLVQ
jgi:hypothetical protein